MQEIFLKILEVDAICVCVCLCVLFAVPHSFNQFVLHYASVVLVDVALLPILGGEKNTTRQPAMNTRHT